MKMRHSLLPLITAGCLALPLAVARPAGAEDLRDSLYDAYGIDFTTFIEARAGARIDRDQDEKDLSVGETRWQIELGRDLGAAHIDLKADFLADGVEENATAALRELNIAFSPLDNLDVKAGRQVLTWGTGDLLFINDLFPKDWESFFIGRDDEYLKAPSDAVKTSVYFDFADLDLIYIPVANTSTYIDGSRLSYWNGLAGRIGDRGLQAADHDRVRVGQDAEYAARLSHTYGSVEAALYFFNGFWKTPQGVDAGDHNLFYPRLSVYGASVRGPVLGGIANAEFGYYDSREDSSGSDPFIRNSEYRYLVGYEHELGPDFTGGLQYYLEVKKDYSAYEANLTPGAPAKDEYRHLLTMRLTKLMFNQNLTLSFFGYWSPSDHDAYLRPKISYKLTDNWTADAGANLFYGRYDHTFWGQFEDNTNIYAGLRWSY